MCKKITSISFLQGNVVLYQNTYMYKYYTLFTRTKREKMFYTTSVNIFFVGRQKMNEG
jgi:hypothetical protein